MNEPPPVSGGSGNRTRHPLAAWAWPVAFMVCVVSGLLVAGHVLRGCTPAGMAEAFKPDFKTTYATTISTSVQSLHREPKLVVLQSEIAVTLTKESQKVFKIVGLPIDLGTTTVRVRCGGNKIQYYVPLNKVTARDFTYSKSAHRLTICVPRPRLDENLVEIQSDPTKMEVETQIGWARLDSRSGKALREAALKDLRSAVIQEGQAELHQQIATAEAEKQIRLLLAPLLLKLREEAEVKIQFK